MNYTSQVRKDIKRECKARTKERLGSCVGLQFLYAIPILLIMLMMMSAMYGDAFRVLASGVALDPEQVDQLLTYSVLNSLDTVMLLTLVLMLISGPLAYGMMQFYIALRRGGEPRASVIFHPFTSLRSLWTGIKMSFCLTFRALLWTIVPVVVWVLAATGIAVAILATGAGEVAMSYALFAFYLLLLIVLIPVFVKLMTYNAGWIVINDEEQYGVWAATRDASHVFKGHYGKLVWFWLSFVPWYVLVFVVIWGCLLLSYAAFILIGGGMGVLIGLLALLAGLCLDVLLSGFLNAYVNTSFIGLYEYFVRAQAATLPNEWQPMQTAEQSAAATPIPPVPVTEPIAEPVAESVAEPVAEPVTEAVTESVVEPVAEPVSEPEAPVDTATPPEA